jgi:hypothetical protein
MWTLSDGTWPTWAADGYLRIGDVVYRVDERKSSTVITTLSDLSPTADLAAGTAYKLYQDSYLLPEDFAATAKAMYQERFAGMEYVHPSAWMQQVRRMDQVGEPRWYTITGDQKYPTDRLVMRVFPYPAASKALDVLYRRQPRPVRLKRLDTGTVTITSGSTAVVGVGTRFAARHVGAVLRVSATSNLAPTSDDGENPADFEGVIKSFTDATHVALVVGPDRDDRRGEVRPQRPHRHPDRGHEDGLRARVRETDRHA